MSTGQGFPGYFTRSLFLASMVFALAHMFQALAMRFVSQHSFQIEATGMFVLIASGLAECAIFFGAGWPIAYMPIYVIDSNILNNAHRRTLIAYVILGFLLGLIFLPLCALVPFLAMHSPYDPTYLARCIEFAYPMTIAGVIGGYALWRFARRAARNGELMADQFS